MISITRYRNTRNFAVWIDGELLAVTVYRKGAEAIAATIRNLQAKVAAACRQQPDEAGSPSTGNQAAA